MNVSEGKGLTAVKATLSWCDVFVCCSCQFEAFILHSLMTPILSLPSVQSSVQFPVTHQIHLTRAIVFLEDRHISVRSMTALNDRGMLVQYPACLTDYSVLQSVQNCPAARPYLCSVGSMVSFTGRRRAETCSSTLQNLIWPVLKISKSG